MFLRDHPLMMYNGVRSWPPVWMWRHGNESNPKGEVGILRDAVLSNVPPHSTCFLIMEYLGAEYIGLLLLDDRDFCHQVVELLQRYRNRPISEIGSLDLSGIFL